MSDLIQFHDFYFLYRYLTIILPQSFQNYVNKINLFIIIAILTKHKNFNIYSFKLFYKQHLWNKHTVTSIQENTKMLISKKSLS